MAPLALVLVMASVLEVQAGATVETRAGEAPLVSGQASEASFASALTPAAAARLRASTSELALQYAPRLYWQHPNALERNRVLVLHQGNAAYTASGELLSFAARAEATVGEADYTALAAALGAQQGALPRSASFYSLRGTTGLSLRSSERTRHRLSLEVVRRGPTSDDALPAVDPIEQDGLRSYPFPTQTVSTLEHRTQHRATRTGDLIGLVALGHLASSGDVQVASVAPQIGWIERTSEHTTVRGAAGVAYSAQRRGGRGDWFDESFTPVGDVGVTSVLLRGRGRELVGSFETGVSWYVDPILAVTGPRGASVARLMLRLPPRWTVAAEVLAATSLSGDPLLMEPDETVIAASLPISYRAAEGIRLEVGARYSERGPHLAAGEFAFRNRELWAYGLMTAQFGASTGARRPAPREGL